MFPTPLGGNVNEYDIIPSAIFLALYALLLPTIIWNLFVRHQWSTYLIGTSLFAIERVVVFGLRLNQARGLSSPTSTGLLIYQQLTLGLGYLSLPGDIVQLHRAALVHTTQSEWNEDLPGESRKRFWFQRYGDIGSLAFIGAIVPGAISGGLYKNATTKQEDADRLLQLRIVSIAIAFTLWQLFGIALAISWIKVKKLSNQVCLRLFCAYVGITTIMIYRLVVIDYKENALTDVGHSSLTSRSAKATFYVLNLVPEVLLITLVMVGKNRDIFHTGRFGDGRMTGKQSNRPKQDDQNGLSDLSREVQNGRNDRNVS